MIRKIVLASAIAVMPIAAVTTVGLSGVASAGGPPPAAASCAISGNIVFPNSGISAFGDTSKKGQSTVTLSSSSAQCASTSDSIIIKTKSAKCSAPVTTGDFSEGAITLHPANNIFPTLPQCANSKNDEADSAWGFAGGVLVNGVASSAASQLPAELKKGVNVVDGGTTYTLLVTAAAGISPGGACGSNAGFALSGDVKKFTSTTWSSNVCLSSDTATGTTGGTFIGDLTNLITATGNTSTDGGAPLTSPVPNTSITGATIDGSTSTLTIS